MIFAFLVVLLATMFVFELYEKFKKIIRYFHYEKKCHLEALRMLAVYAQDFHALKCIKLSGVKIDFSILHFDYCQCKVTRNLCKDINTIYFSLFPVCSL